MNIKAGNIIQDYRWPEPVEIKLIENIGNYIRIVGATIHNFDNGVFEKNLPPGIEFPDWLKEMQKFHEIKTGEKIDSSKPVIGWLDSKETAANVYKTTIDFIEAISKILYQANHSKIH